MKALAFLFCLPMLTVHAYAQSRQAPSGHYLSGQYASDLHASDLDEFIRHAPADNPPPPVRAFAGKLTYTYLRCHYRSDTQPGGVRTSYEWATQKNGQWYRVPGYWRADGLLAWSNMFYSDTPQGELHSTCADTLARKGIGGEPIMVSGADSALSFNYTIWTQQDPVDSRETERIIVFGDSLSDMQNLYNATLWKVPQSDSWFLGRFSNGPVWPEYLGRTMQLTPYVWAVAGAAADQFLVIPGFSQQVDSWHEYMREARNYDPAKSLFYVMVGANDLVVYGRSPDQSLMAVEQGLRKLLAAGARKIVVSNLPDVTRAPTFRTRNDGEAVARNLRAYNVGLAELVQRLSAEHPMSLTLFDAYTFFGRILDAPEQAGFTDVRQSCLQIDTSRPLSYLLPHNRRPNCTPDTFVFWDTLHPTTRMHREIADAIRAATPPSWQP